MKSFKLMLVAGDSLRSIELEFGDKHVFFTVLYWALPDVELDEDLWNFCEFCSFSF
jgi:hypothetical protein